jgi:hypothetical protein
VAHRDLASRIHVRNAAESGQTRIDVKRPDSDIDKQHQAAINAA